MKKPTPHHEAAANDGVAARDLSQAIEQRLGSIAYRRLGEVVPCAGNPHKHPERQIVQLSASIGHFGFTMPLLVDEDSELICGHARLEAARRLGTDEVPVLVARSWSKARIKAYRLADNQLARAATWDEELLRIELSSIIELDEAPIESWAGQPARSTCCCSVTRVRTRITPTPTPCRLRLVNP